MKKGAHLFKSSRSSSGTSGLSKRSEATQQIPPLPPAARWLERTLLRRRGGSMSEPAEKWLIFEHVVAPDDAIDGIYACTWHSNLSRATAVRDAHAMGTNRRRSGGSR